LSLSSDKLVSKFAFKFNLYCYAEAAAASEARVVDEAHAQLESLEAARAAAEAEAFDSLASARDADTSAAVGLCTAVESSCDP
jgi:hypothetical protein